MSKICHHDCSRCNSRPSVVSGHWKSSSWAVKMVAQCFSSPSKRKSGQISAVSQSVFKCQVRKLLNLYTWLMRFTDEFWFTSDWRPCQKFRALWLHKRCLAPIITGGTMKQNTKVKFCVSVYIIPSLKLDFVLFLANIYEKVTFSGI